MSVMAAQTYEVKAGLDLVSAFDVIGISAVISGRDNAAEEINALWQDFFSQQIVHKIEGRVDDVIYAVYSDYEGDHTKPYRLTIGYKVAGANDISTNDIKDGLFTAHVKEANYAMMSAAGEQPKALIETWTAIWQSDLDRKFESDFEVYGQRFFEEGVHEILVAVGVNILK